MSSTTNTITLAQRWADLERGGKGVRIRDAAEQLGCSEAELLASIQERPDLRLDYAVTRLGADDLRPLFAEIPKLGRVMALTRNEAVVSETYGEYGEIDLHANTAVVHTEGIDLRVDFTHWRHAFAVTMKRPRGELRGLHFFDADGTAVHKVYLTDDSDHAAYDEACGRFAAPAGEPIGPHALEVAEARPAPDRRGGSEVDPETLRDAWRAVGNVHRFQAMLARLKVNRLAALRAVGTEFARPAAADSHRTVLEGARDGEIPIMVFVRSPGCTQIHTGPVRKLARADEYFNVFDPDFHLHVREPRLAEAWLVRKPVAEDTVTSIEIYTA
ncbi:MAG: ChuX/HutX family heme-like substrate-binding protein, partial [Spirochaetota bacterium]